MSVKRSADRTESFQPPRCWGELTATESSPCSAGVGGRAGAPRLVVGGVGGAEA